MRNGRTPSPDRRRAVAARPDRVPDAVPGQPAPAAAQPARRGRPRRRPPAAPAPADGRRRSPAPGAPPVAAAPVPAAWPTSGAAGRGQRRRLHRRLHATGRPPRVLAAPARSRTRAARPEEMVPACAGTGRGRSTSRPAIPTSTRASRTRSSVPSAEHVTWPRARRTRRCASSTPTATSRPSKTLDRSSRGATSSSCAASVRSAGGRELPARIVWGPGIGNPTAGGDGRSRATEPPQGVCARPRRRRAPARQEDRRRPVARPGGVRWAGVESHHFAALCASRRAPRASARAARRRRCPARGRARSCGRWPPSPCRATDAGRAPLRGTQGPHALARLGHGLEQVVPSGTGSGPSWSRSWRSCAGSTARSATTAGRSWSSPSSSTW